MRDIPVQVDEAVVRSNALLTDAVALVVVVLAFGGFDTAAAVLMGLLAADFAVRGFLNPRRSLLSSVSIRFVADVLWFPHRLIYFPPKRFAARVGLVFSGAAAILFLAGWRSAGVAVTGVLAVFAALEWSIAVCMGCIVYNSIAGAVHHRRHHRRQRSGRGGTNDGV